MAASPHQGRRPTRRGWGHVLLVIAALALACSFAETAFAGSYITYVSDTTGYRDADLQQDSPSHNSGDSRELRLKIQNGKNRNILSQFPVGGFANRTILQAWLMIRHKSMTNNASPIDARIFPVTESWYEPEVTWAERDVDLPWARPGGTRGPFWSGRALVTPATKNTKIAWQVGPIIRAWQAGDLPNLGVLIEPVQTGLSREAELRSMDYDDDPSQRPGLLIYSTDEPPAVQNGWAEIQPREVPLYSLDAPFTLWLDVDASRMTPTGTPTGFDVVTVIHNGALAVTGVDGLSVPGEGQLDASLPWYDNGTTFNVYVPRWNRSGRFGLRFRANVLSTETALPTELQVLVDDASTPGVWPQILWPGDADGLAGNGDSWNLQIKGSQPISIDLQPDTVTVLQTLCTPFELFGTDTLGTRFTLVPDSLVVRPFSRGSFDEIGQFCAAEAGPTTIIAYYGGLTDTSNVLVTPALYPQISRIELLDRQGVAVNALAPQDTMFLEADLGDANGFDDITELKFRMHYRGHEDDRDAPAYRAEFRWWPGSGGGWTQLDPSSSTWKLLTSLCSVDLLADPTAPHTVRLAFVPSMIARASNDSGWTASVEVSSLTPADVRTGELANLNALTYLEVVSLDPEGQFAPGEAGATRLPLGTPTDGHLSLRLYTNTPHVLEAAVGPMVGTEAPSETLRVDPPYDPITWALGAATSGGALGTAYTALTGLEPAPEFEGPEVSDLFLWIDLDAALSPQVYQGALRLRLTESGGTGSPAQAKIPLAASVAGNGLAAQSAIAEVTPHQVEAGLSTQELRAYLLPTFRIADTGIDRVMINVPDGYGTPQVTALRIAGLPAGFTDLSRAGLATVQLQSPLTATRLVEVVFTASTPLSADSTGADFTVLFDDSSTALGAQTAVEGDANGLPDGDNWRVSVTPGPLASLAIEPDSATCFVDSTLAFTASAWDAHGNPVKVSPTWATLGGVGVISASTGLFTGLNAGVGWVIAASGGVSDTAVVEVRPYLGIAVRSVQGRDTVYQAQSNVVMEVVVENTGVVPVLLDSLDLVFSRTSMGDADDEFTAISISGNQGMLAAGESASFDFDVQVHDDAGTGTVTVDARAVARDTSGVPLGDSGADVPHVLVVVPGGIELEASQTSAIARPGSDLGPMISLTLRNYYPEPRTFRSLSISNATQGPGSRANLDTELGALTLLRADSVGNVAAAAETLAVRVTALDGEVHFAPLELTIPAGGSLRLEVHGHVPLAARDGDVLDLSVASPAAVAFDQQVVFRNAWPVAPAGSFPVDGMTAAQIALKPVVSGNFMAGSKNNLAFDVLLPVNGYEPDRLERFGVVNLGTARAGSDIQSVKLWVDDGDGKFSAAADRLSRSLSYTGSRWEATGLNEAVAAGGVRVYVTVDLYDLATDGHTVRFALPSLPDLGVGMTSGNDGPLDVALGNPFVQSVSTVDRVTFNAVPIASGAVAPGQSGVVLAHLIATNTYSTPRTLVAVGFRNATAGPGSAAQLDRELARLELRLDGDDDGTLGDPSLDPVIGAAFFSDGKASFTGFQWVLAAGESRHLFLTGDVSLSEAADGDTLAAEVASSADLAFDQPTALAASFPLKSGARMAVDGLVAAQITNVGASGVTLGHDDGPVLALDLIVPANGYRADVLQSLQVVNTGDAGVPEIAELRLWRDGGDGVFSAGGGDDSDLGPMAWAGGGWQSASLAAPLSGSGARLFVALTVSSSPSESTVVRLSVPVGGIQTESANDGPRDQAVVNPQPLLISTSSLLASLALSPQATTVGGTVTLRMVVRNIGTETVQGITPSAPAASGSGTLALSGGPSPASFDLAPAASDTFVWTYTAAAAGDVQFSSAAQGVGETSSLVRRSLTVFSPTEQIFTQLNQIEVFPLQSMPFAISRGQTGVVPFSLTLSNNGGASASDARLLGLRVRLEDENGAGVVPAELMRRVVVNEGTNVYLVKTALEATGAEVDLTLATPILVKRLEPVTLSLTLDISDSTTVPNFRVVVPDETWFTVQDATSGAPVTVALASGSFPLRSGLGRIVSAATRLDVQGLPAAAARVDRGARDVPLLGVRLTNPGVGGIVSGLRVTSFGVTLADTMGGPLPEPADALERIEVWNGAQKLASVALSPGEGADRTLTLNPALEVPVNTPIDLSITGDIWPAAPLGALRLQLRGPQFFTAVDATSGDTVTAVFATEPLAGPAVLLEAPAETLRVVGSPRLPATLLVGEPGVEALSATLRHPGSSGTARIRVDSLTVHCRDDAGTPLQAASVLGGVRIFAGALELGSLSSPPPGASSFAIPLSGPFLEPGASLDIRLVIDVSPVAPSTFLELTIPGSGIRAVDANSGEPVTPEGERPVNLPLVSGLGRLATPARELSVGLASRMPAVWAADGNPVSAAVLSLSNGAASGSGSIFLDRLVIAGADRDFAALAVGAAASRVRAYVDDVLWAESPDLSVDSLVARLAGDTLEIRPGEPVLIELRIVPRTGGAPPSFRLGVDEAGIGVVQPASALLTVSVQPSGGSSFPLWTEAGGTSPTSLAESYSNYPNPFAAGREPTSFVYYLPEPARVSLRIWTARGELVATVLDGAARPAGLSQVDQWDGKNGRGQTVLNGVYVAELVVKLAGGGSNRVLRKVAVVR